MKERPHLVKNWKWIQLSENWQSVCCTGISFVFSSLIFTHLTIFFDSANVMIEEDGFKPICEGLMKNASLEVLECGLILPKTIFLSIQIIGNIFRRKPKNCRNWNVFPRWSSEKQFYFDEAFHWFVIVSLFCLKNKSLQTISKIESNGINSDGAYFVSEGLKGNSTLSVLKMSFAFWSISSNLKKLKRFRSQFFGSWRCETYFGGSQGQ